MFFSMTLQAAQVAQVNRARNIVLIKESRSVQNLYAVNDKVTVHDVNSGNSFDGHVVAVRESRVAVSLNEGTSSLSKGRNVRLEKVDFNSNSNFAGYYIRANPFSALLGFHFGEVGTTIGNNFILGLNGFYVGRPLSFDVLHGFGVGSTIGYNTNSNIDDSWFIKLAGRYLQLESTEKVYNPPPIDDAGRPLEVIGWPTEHEITIKASGFLVESYGGYQWFWQNGIHINFGLGIIYAFADKSGYTETGKQLDPDSPRLKETRNVTLAGELSLGYMF